jgi:hypothetical protein
MSGGDKFSMGEKSGASQGRHKCYQFGMCGSPWRFVVIEPFYRLKELFGKLE